jgi:uncharacterized protein (TIGR02646 family)
LIVRYIPRTANAPTAFTAAAKKEAAKVLKFYTVPAALVQVVAGKKAKKPTSYPFKAYKADDAKERLSMMFAGKCAYCEVFYSSSAPVDIEHYRPKGSVEGAPPTHRGYWWLASDWENLLPSCIDCNRRRKQTVYEVSTSLHTLMNSPTRAPTSSQVSSGKKDAFPIDGPLATDPLNRAELDAELPLLLNPTVDDPDAHLKFMVEPNTALSLVLPVAKAALTGAPVLDRRGAMSIQFYGLNRLGLVQDRTRLLRHLEFLGEVVVEKTAPSHARKLGLLVDKIIAEMRAATAPDRPFSALASTWVESFAARLSPP